jgi:hypothetical protein
MDDMILLREIRPEPAPANLDRARTRLLTEIEAERPHRRRRVGVVAGLALAAAVAATVVLVPWDRITGGSPTSASADPVVLLSEAAAYARSQPFVVPRPDQFVYVPPQAWISVDGKHDGWAFGEVLYACINGKARDDHPKDPNHPLDDCTPAPGYRADMPTTTDGMIHWLRTAGPTFTMKGIADVLSTQWLRPESKAALFEAATRIPGLTVLPRASVEGRTGFGLKGGSPANGYDVLVFDRHTLAYLGSYTIGVNGAIGTSRVHGAAAIVDHPREYPR